MATGQQVADFLGRGGEIGLVVLAEDHAGLVTTFVKAYTHGRGFDATGAPNAELDAVIVTATARTVVNPTGDRRVQLGDYGVTPHAVGWTLTELAVLHRWRPRAA